MDLKFSTRIKNQHILDEFEGQGHQGQKCKNPSFQLVSGKVVQGQNATFLFSVKFQGQGRKAPGQRSQRSRSNVAGQGQCVKVKDFEGVFYPIDPRGVRHAGIFITNTSVCVTWHLVILQGR